MKHVMKISTVAFHAIWGKKELNLQRMLDYIELAAGEGSNLVVFPEMALTGYDDKKEQPKAEKMQVLQAETVPGPSSQRIAEAARKFGLYVAFGLPERDRWDPGAVYNSACVCGPEGILGVYRKIHLAYPEPHWAIRGRDPFLFQTPWGPIGVGICYDSYCFPELMRQGLPGLSEPLRPRQMPRHSTGECLAGLSQHRRPHLCGHLESGGEGSFQCLLGRRQHHRPQYEFLGGRVLRGISLHRSQSHPEPDVYGHGGPVPGQSADFRKKSHTGRRFRLQARPVQGLDGGAAGGPALPGGAEVVSVERI